jgi:hypothetical protein
MKLSDLAGMPVHLSDHIPKGEIWLIGNPPNESILASELPPPGILSKETLEWWAKKCRVLRIDLGTALRIADKLPADWGKKDGNP